MKRKWLSMIGIAVLSLSLYGCGEQNSTPKAEENSSVDVQTAGDSTTAGAATRVVATQETRIAYNDNDYDTTSDLVTATLKLNGDSIICDGSGVKVEGTTATISAAGTYVLEGKLTDGTIIIDADKKDVVHLILNGVEIHSESSAAIYVPQSEKCIITLAEGKDNSLSNGSYTVEEGADTPDAALYVQDDCTINGTGSLQIDGKCHNGISCKDNLKIMDGVITVSAVNNGILGKDSISVAGGTITVNSENDGIKSNNTTDDLKGYIAVDDGTIKITAAGDGLSAETSVLLAGGTFDITAGGGSTGEFKQEEMGNFRKGSFAETASTEETTTEEVSNKGVKAGVLLEVTDGEYTVNSLDDAFHVNGNANIHGGKFTIASTDDGIHADDTLVIDGGTIQITESYEGLEAYSMTINGGEITLKAADDGINIAGGNDSSNEQGMRGGDSFKEASLGDALTVNGGTLTVSAEGDGLDSNGSLYIKGGTITVNGPTNSGNGGMDYGAECVVSGGTLMMSGSSGMNQGPSDSSTQAVINAVIENPGKAGDTITLKDSTGTAILSYIAEKEYQALILSSAEIQAGQTYTLVCGETETQITTETDKMVTNMGSSGQMNGMENGRGGGGRGNRQNGFEKNNGEKPERPSGDWSGTKDGEVPVKPSGELPIEQNGNMPTMPSGEPNGETPAMPSEDPAGTT